MGSLCGNLSNHLNSVNKIFSLDGKIKIKYPSEKLTEGFNMSNDIWLVPVKSIMGMYNALQKLADDDPNCPLTEEKIIEAFEKKDFQADYQGSIYERNNNYHIKRIAYFMEFPDDKPIEIDVGIPVLNYYHAEDIVIEDGHHRLFAAHFAKREFIPVTFAGQASTFHEFFPEAKLKTI